MTAKKVPVTKFQSPQAVESLPEWQRRGKERAIKLAKEKVNSLTLAIYAYLRAEEIEVNG